MIEPRKAPPPAAQTLSVGSAGVSVAVAAGLFYVSGDRWTDNPGFGLVYWCAAILADAQYCGPWSLEVFSDQLRAARPAAAAADCMRSLAELEAAVSGD